MFSLTGVAKPDLDVDAITAKASHYARLAAATSTATSDTTGAVSAVLATNDGPAASAFNAQMTGGDSISTHLSDLTTAASRTASAYTSAAVSGNSTQVAMISLATAYAQRLRLARSGRATQAELNALVESARSGLMILETGGVIAINSAFAAVSLPPSYTTTSNDENGHLDQGIAEEWANLTDAERRQVLQRIADEYADAQGYPRIDIDFEPIESDPGMVTFGQYSHSLFNKSLTLNSDQLSNPQLINTVVHEMEHRGQYEGMGFRWPWQDERAGMSRADAQRWEELNSDYIRGKGGSDWDSYSSRPVEVGARQAGRDFINNMTLEEFQAYL